jgi:hypothetical protein
MASQTSRPPVSTWNPSTFDRRSATRLVPPPCPQCAGSVRVVSRTDYVLYLRCQCAYLWSTPKPGGYRL